MSDERPAPTFSVVMPAFNAQSTIERAVASIIDQSESNWELIVVDDCSTDRTAELVLRLAQLDRRVRLLRHGTNRGVAAARNSGLDAAAGEYVAFVDSDDECLPRYLELLHTGFADDVDVVLGGRLVIGDGSEVVIAHSPAVGTFTGAQAVRLAMLDRLTPFPWDKLFRRSALDGVRFPEGLARFEDMMLNIVVYARARQVRSIATPVYRYHVSSTSLTWGRVPEAHEAREAIEYLVGNLPESASRGTAFRSMRALVTVLIAQSAIARGRGGAQQRLVVEQCRATLAIPDIAGALISSPRVGLAAALLKCSPSTYSSMYLRYIRRRFGLAAPPEVKG